MCTSVTTVTIPYIKGVLYAFANAGPYCKPTRVISRKNMEVFHHRLHILRTISPYIRCFDALTLENYKCNKY